MTDIERTEDEYKNPEGWYPEYFGESSVWKCNQEAENDPYGLRPMLGSMAGYAAGRKVWKLCVGAQEALTSGIPVLDLIEKKIHDQNDNRYGF